jgi:Tfp pilus assembly protein PilF
MDRYRLDRELGHGGMATVYLAHDLKHGRDVALKVLRPELAAILGRERFLAEIRLTARLDHPHILTLIDSGESDGYLWYVLPYIRGESLRQRLDRERQLGLDEALAVAADIAAALDYAHAHGVVHRDVKPENILLHEGEAMLMDFGIALAVREAGGERLTETGLSVGTPHYMSPEQATAERQLDARSDVYSLGAVLYEMLAGEPPFTGATGQAVIAKMMTERPTRLRTVRDTVPEGVDAAVARALAKVPADRFPSAAAFAAALRNLEPAPASRPSWSLGRHWRAVLAAGALAALVFLLAWQLGTSRLGPERPRGDPEVSALYQRGVHAFERRTAAGTVEALRNFSAVLQRDSTYAPAWTGLSKTLQRAYFRYFPLPGISRDSMTPLAVFAVERALAADPKRADAWVAQAMVSRMLDPTDVAPSLRSLRKALALDSMSGPAWHNLAITLADSGAPGEALAAWRRCVTVAPSYAEGLAFRGLADYWRRQYDSAMVWVDSATAVDPNYLLARTVAGQASVERGDFSRATAAFDAAQRLVGPGDIEVVHGMAGSALAAARGSRPQEARITMQRAESLAKAYTPTPLHTAVFMAHAYVALGDANSALKWLTSYEPRRDLHFQLHLRCDPPFDPIGQDPRFRALLIGPRPPDGC